MITQTMALGNICHMYIYIYTCNLYTYFHACLYIYICVCVYTYIIILVVHKGTSETAFVTIQSFDKFPVSTLLLREPSLCYFWPFSKMTCKVPWFQKQNKAVYSSVYSRRCPNQTRSNMRNETHVVFKPLQVSFVGSACLV